MKVATGAERNEDEMPPAPPLRVFRRYVTDFVNRHDFTVLPEIMRDDYTLITSGMTISGRDGPYRTAVARQFDQFPGLMFTVHELFVSGNQIGIRFTEHGAEREEGREAAWPSIAIYEVSDDRLARCTIEQDYFSRRRQLATARPVPVDFAAPAPWDEPERQPDPQAEQVVGAWLASAAFLDTPAVQIDDSHATGMVERIVDGGDIAIDKMVSGDGRVAFHAEQRGPLAADFGAETGAKPGDVVHLHMSGLVHVENGAVTGGNVIRDRWGLYRRLGRPA